MLTGFIHLISELEKSDGVKADINKTEVNPTCPLMFHGKYILKDMFFEI